MGECSHFDEGDHSMLGTLEDGTVQCATCKARFVPASKLDSAAQEIAKLKEQDEVHWKTRQSLLKDIAHEQDMANQANVACIGLQGRLDSALARLEWSTQQLDIEQAATKAATDRLEAGANAWAGSGAFNNHECYFGSRIGKCPESNECWECRLHLALYPLPPVVEKPATIGVDIASGPDRHVERAAITDGFGGRWLRCELPDCDLHVCRPGKSQCHHDKCPRESNWPSE